MLDGVPEIYHDFTGPLYTAIGHLIIRHIHQQAALLQPALLNDGLIGQGDADNDITVWDSLPRISNCRKLHRGVLGLGLFHKALRILGADIIDIDRLNARANDQGSFQLSPPLGPGSTDGHDLSVLTGQQLHGHTAGRTGPLGADLCTIRNADRKLRIRIIENHCHTGPGQPLFIVHGTAADPLDSGHIVLTADVAGHGIDAAQDIFILRRGAPAHNTLAWH